MDRRKSIKALVFSAVAPAMLFERRDENQPAKIFLPHEQHVTEEALSFNSSWMEWPDMNWTGPEFWGNRLQDWRIRDGKLECLIRGSNRTLHCLATQLNATFQPFQSTVFLRLPGNEQADGATAYAGFRLGAKARNRVDDYRCAAVFGEGLDAGITYAGNLFIGTQKSVRPVPLNEEVRMVIDATPVNNTFTLTLSVFNPVNNTLIDQLAVSGISNESVTGNIALVVHHANEVKRDLGITAEGNPLHVEVDKAGSGHNAQQATGIEVPLAIFSEWKISGSKIVNNPHQTFGPVCFAQYTIDKKVLKITAQLTPVETIRGNQVFLQVYRNNHWETLKESTVDPFGRIANFRIENWGAATNVHYRIKLNLPLKNGTREFFYEGTIAAEPVASHKLKIAVFSCNGDYGFPDTEIATNVKKHHPDLAVFLGDQFYESHGGFQIQTFPIDKACLDYLRKWYMFGWSYREVFRHIPCAIIPDDHDVYHGNVWGEGGKHAPSENGWAYPAQDAGGYKMPAKWVNMVQQTQTSHLPDPYDPTPVKQGIGVYYTNWNYGGISFAILEDRKFKSAPKNVLPAEAEVQNGFIQNPAFDIKQHRDIDAVLLGDRQIKFLNEWSSDWKEGVEMKCVLSQTNFCTVATLPKGSMIDSVVPGLPIPQLGEYVTGDTPTADMDSNGWPQKGRDQAIKEIRKCFAFHIAGDQHIASIVHYGVDSFGDSGYSFAGPALNNIFPRRWWPPVENHQPLSGKPLYTGNFLDGFGNRMTVHAVANPHKTQLKPAIVYDRATGYGMVTFDKENRTIHTECWPRYVDPKMETDGQYKGWPLTITQEDNYGRKAEAWLPTVKVNGLNKPVIELFDERTGESVYSLRLKSKVFQPKVFSEGKYTIRISDGNKAVVKERKNIEAKQVNKDTILFSL